MIVQWLIASYKSAAAVTYATWNPSDKSANITLSVSNTVATSSGGSGWYSARSTIWKSTWKHYWEITITSGTVWINGIMNSTASLANYAGSDANWYGFYWDWTSALKFNSGASSAYGASAPTGTVLWFALDMTGWTLTIYKNNVSQGTMYSGISWTFFAWCSFLNTSAWSITANFWATTMAYTAPSWFNQWLYT